MYMEKKCSTENCGFAAEGATEEEAEQKLQSHATEAHDGGNAPMPSTDTGEESGASSSDESSDTSEDNKTPEGE